MKISLIQCLVAVIFTGVSLAHDASAQEVLQKRITLKIENQEIRQVLSAIEKQTSVKFAYRPVLIPANQKISLSATNEALSLVLTKITKPLNLTYEVVGQQIILSPIPETGSSPTGMLPRAITPPADRQLSGTVTDENKAGLPGVSVVLKGTQRGTTTNAEGQFQIEVPDAGSSTVVFSFVGYVSQEVVVGNQSTLQIAMTPESKALNEVVVVGYGVQKKADLTGAIATISADKIKNRAAVSYGEALVGQMAGVQVQQTNGAPGGEGLTIRVRGTGSITAGSAPLVRD